VAGVAIAPMNTTSASHQAIRGFDIVRFLYRAQLLRGVLGDG